MTWFRNFRSSVHDIYSCDLLQQAITALYAKILIILGEKQMMEENRKHKICLFRSVSAPDRRPLSEYFSGVLSIFLHFPLHWKSQLYLLRLFPTFHKKVKLGPQKRFCVKLFWSDFMPAWSERSKETPRRMRNFCYTRLCTEMVFITEGSTSKLEQ